MTHPGPDLLSWPEAQAARVAHAAALDAAAQRVARALEAYRDAVQRCRRAPHGEIGHRQTALRQANLTLLQAEVDLALLEREGADLA